MNKFIITIFISIFTLSLWGQQPKDTLNTEIINVVKPYAPTISDAFKVKDQPNTADDLDSAIKEEINYQINSVPVASTFTPSKGKAKKVARPKKERLYDNYVSLGFGNYTTPLLEAYVRVHPLRDAILGATLKHHSSQGGANDLLLDDSFYNTSLGLYYAKSSRKMNWKINTKAQHQVYNWYGVLNTEDSNAFTESFLDNFDAKQQYLNLALAGKLIYFNSIFKELETSLSHFSDAYKSSEVRLRIQPKFTLPIDTESVDLKLDLDYLRGNFNQSYQDTNVFSYSYLNIGLLPSFKVVRDDLRLNLGVKAYYTLAAEKENTAFKIYPNIDASYQLLADVLAVFAGATGGLHYNTYLDLVQENPFVSPTHNSIPTDEKYRVFAGVKGKLASNITYLFKASYADEDNKALQVANQVKTNGLIDTEVKAYELGNSFGVVYDRVKTLGLHGDLVVDFSKEFSFGGSVDYNSYVTENQIEAWNLPKLKATLFTAYNTGKWRGEAKVFIVGDRKDLVMPQIVPVITPFPYEDYVVTNKSYVDLNLGLSYAFTARLSAFAKGHNLLGVKYKRFYNYPVQGLQALAGVTYKFDL